MGITKIPLVLISGFYLDYKKRKTGFYRDYEKPRKMAKKVVWGFRFFFRDSWGFFRGFRFFFQDSSGFLGILRDSVIFLVISAALPPPPLPGFGKFTEVNLPSFWYLVGASLLFLALSQEYPTFFGQSDGLDYSWDATQWLRTGRWKPNPQLRPKNGGSNLVLKESRIYSAEQ